jgi:thiol-disulfide isomerase/thioredoxin
MTVAQLRGQPTLLWFVATWCSSCESGTQVLASHVDQLRAHGVRVVEVMLYQDLGQAGPSIGDFARLAGDAAGSDWIFGTSSRQLTARYDPSSYLDIYYLLDRHGTVRYINGSPTSTLPDLIAHAEKLT